MAYLNACHFTKVNGWHNSNWDSCSFALIILLVALAEGVGAEYILGAFLAGVVVSLLNPDEEMVEKLDSFGYGFFIPIFFIMVGVDLNIPSLIKEPSLLLIIPVLIIAFVVSKLIPVLFIKRWFDTKTTIASAFLLTSTLSLVIAAAKSQNNLKRFQLRPQVY